MTVVNLMHKRLEPVIAQCIKQEREFAEITGRTPRSGADVRAEIIKTANANAGHTSDCALHRGPAHPPGWCSCGGPNKLRLWIKYTWWYARGAA